MEAGMESTHEMLRLRGLPEIAALEVYREIFDFPIKEYYRALGFDFEKEPYHVLAPLWVALYNEKSKSSRLAAGVTKTLDHIASTNIRQVVFSATEIEMLKRQLSGLGIMGYFDEIIGLENIHAESKLHLAVRWKEEHPEAKILYVGDTVHDAENAKILGADCLLFCGGHQSRRRLEKCNFPIISGIDEVIEYIK